MADPFVYAIDQDGNLNWYRHVGQEDGSFRWEGPKTVGIGWGTFEHVFSGGDGIIYAIEPRIEATVQIQGPGTPASGGRLLWQRHVGREDGSFEWEGPKTVGTGWSGFEHVFSGGDGVIYVVEKFVDASVAIDGPGTKASGGRLRWYRHVGREDGSFRWQGPTTVGTGWSGFPHVFASSHGVIYLVEPVIEAGVTMTGPGTRASGGNLRWYRHLGRLDGTFRWEGPSRVGKGWNGFPHVAAAEDGVIYLVEPVVEARVNINGPPTPASGGDLRWYRHLGQDDGTFRWEGPNRVGRNWAGLKKVFSGGVRSVVTAGQRFCDFPDSPDGVGLRPTAYTLTDHRRKVLLSWTVISLLPGVDLPRAMFDAFAIWKSAVPQLTFVPVPSAAVRAGAPANPSADITISAAAFAAGSPAAASTNFDGTTIAFNSGVPWRNNNAAAGAANNLLAVAVHEIGHALGLRHSTADTSTMNAWIAPVIEGVDAESVIAASALYGWEPQRRLADRGTDSGPALCACGSILAMAWKGVKGDSNIYYASSLDGLSWSPQKVVSGVGTTDSPSLAWDGARLWMAWTGVQGDSALYYATTSDPTSWPNNPGVQIGGVGSSNGPSIAMLPGPTLVWKGIPGDSGVFMSVFNGRSNPPWGAQTHIPGIGSSDRPTVSTDVTGNPLLVWKGIGNDSNLYATTRIGVFWQPQQPVAWILIGNGTVGTTDVRFPGTSCGPAIATDGTTVFAAWRGAGDDSGIWFTQRAQDVVAGTNVVAWSAQGNVPHVGTSHRPAAAYFGGRLHLAWKGSGSDQAIWMTRR